MLATWRYAYRRNTLPSFMQGLCYLPCCQECSAVQNPAVVVLQMPDHRTTECLGLHRQIQYSGLHSSSCQQWGRISEPAQCTGRLWQDSTLTIATAASLKRPVFVYAKVGVFTFKLERISINLMSHMQTLLVKKSRQDEEQLSNYVKILVSDVYK